MPETLKVVTNERETAYQEEATTPAPKMPSVQVFKEIVGRHCHNQGVLSVTDLCTQQTQALIDELAPYFG